MTFKIDTKLLKEARRVGWHKTPAEAIRAAPEEYVRRHRQTRIFRHFGTIDFDPTYDYKAERQRKRM